MLTNKNIVLGVTGSIAAYKIANLASALKKLNANVDVIMTENATNFINPITFETLTGNKCIVDTFDRGFQHNVEHISLAKKADLFLVAPASANIIAKLAHGIADDMLSTTALAFKCKCMVAPAMNSNMYTNPIVQENIDKLRGYGYEIIEPASGYLACGDTGVGKMVSEEVLLDYIIREVALEKDMAGKKVIISAGATLERIDPVRFISNHSTGRMGYALARNAMLRGAEVTLVTAKSPLTPPPFVKVINVESAQDMFEAFDTNFRDNDIVVKAAAVSDYTPMDVADEKIKKKEGDASIPLKRTKDILAHMGANKQEGQFICGFSMETQNMLENSQAKLARKNADMMIANSLRDENAGFASVTNKVTMITAEDIIEYPLMSKEDLSHIIFTEILKKMA